MMIAIAGLFLAVMRTMSLLQSRARKRRKNPNRTFKKGLDTVTYILYGISALCIVIALVLPNGRNEDKKQKIDDDTLADVPDDNANVDTEPKGFTPKSVLSTEPSNWGISWEIFSNGTKTDRFEREEQIQFGEPEDYFALPGIATFRGNNYRNSATYGTANVTDEEIATLWTADTGILEGTSWSGSGWTGQPLIVKWDSETRQIMNLYSEKKAKDGLTEVIYACLDGRIYFLDLDDGSATRDPIDIGLCFKGAGALDPRGYPIMYVGSGDVNSEGERPAMYIISLIDGSVLYKYGDNDSLSLRTDNDNWCAFDSSPLVDAETDTLIWPGESGILYTIKLNTSYDKAVGTLSISPDTPVVTRYKTARSTEDEYWYGYEASADIVDGYLYVSENGGMFYCVDLNTMELVWAQDTADDSNSTPVFEKISEEESYVYTAPSLHWTADENMEGTINIYKLNAETGEVVWKQPYDVHTVSGVSGGVQSTPLLGKKGSDIEGLIIYSIARTPSEGSGILVALNTETGEEAWRVTMDAYAWSSPVAIYNSDGTAYIALCDSWGYISLVKGNSGEVVYTADLGYLVEASPAVFNDTLVVGTRDQKIYALKIK